MIQSSPKKKKRALGLSYLIDENPPWYICLLLGFQVRIFITVFAMPHGCQKGSIIVPTGNEEITYVCLL